VFIVIIIMPVFIVICVCDVRRTREIVITSAKTLKYNNNIMEISLAGPDPTYVLWQRDTRARSRVYIIIIIRLRDSNSGFSTDLISISVLLQLRSIDHTKI